VTRKIFLILLAVVLALSVGLVACGGGEEEEEEEEPEVKPLQHFEGYQIDIVNMPYIGQPVQVADKFGNWTATAGMSQVFCNPVEKTYNGATEGVLDEVFHSMVFGLQDLDPGPAFWEVTVTNQFRDEQLVVYGPIGLFVPTGKGALGEPQGYNCYLGYDIIDPLRLDVHVDLQDQFDEPGIKEDFLVTQPTNFGTPAWMSYNDTTTDIVNDDDYFVNYFIYNAAASMQKNQIDISNVFGQWTVNVTEQKEGYLSVPSQLGNWSPSEPPLDHFKFYEEDMPSTAAVGDPVVLEDQFGIYNATVGTVWAFGNPVVKGVNEIAAWETYPISHPDYHLTLYKLEGIVPTGGSWKVTIDNQFGTQYLTVQGPVGLAVPTHKSVPGDHDSPEGLDYFLCYNVANFDPAVAVTVDLIDELTTYPDNDFVVTDTFLFANPVRITYNGDVTDYDREAHLVFYKGDFHYYVDPDPASHLVEISNLFDPFSTFTVVEEVEAILAVPSEKVNWSAE
jgi:hypothetical protein